MLLSIEVSLYCPRFVVMDVRDGKPKIIYTAVNDHLRESAMAQRRRTPQADLLLEINEKLSFILTAYPIKHAVWSMRQLAEGNMEAAKLALGAVLLTLVQHGVSSDEMQRSRMQLLLTGKSKCDSRLLHEKAMSMFPSLCTAHQYVFPALIAAAWLKAYHYLEMN